MLNNKWEKVVHNGKTLYWFCRLSKAWTAVIFKQSGEELNGVWVYQFVKNEKSFYESLDRDEYWDYMQSARAEANRIIAKANEMTANKRKKAVGV
jgi:hypothetical protein